ncbi:DUF4013 domain-containing protein [Halegenticoccus tardaugens]|uniref:DUF4013 domain-containing protein n=1 Tax=Halegenticoccus tardaugens TaxID=2071624 RepID=UPI00100A7D3E|nr:DUF4013 domain-containing protein [Halegenticoccus tardaugens]
MISESLTYLRNSEDWVRTVLIGGLLTLLSFLVIPAFAVVGYLLRVVRATMRGVDEAPEFDDWGDLLVDGVKGTVIAVIYGLVPAVVGVALVAFGVIGASAGDSGVVSTLGGIVALVGALIALVFGLLAAYVIPAALANYAEHDRLSAGFAVSDLRPVLASGTYATGWLYAFLVVVAGGAVSGLLNAIPLVGFVVGAFVSFYAAVAAYYIIGRTWAKLHPVEMREGELTDERPAV